MNLTRVFGVILVVVGTVLIVLGLQGSDSLAEEMSNIFSGRFTHAAAWQIAGGAAAAVLGLFLVMFGRRRRRRSALGVVA